MQALTLDIPDLSRLDRIEQDNRKYLLVAANILSLPNRIAISFEVIKQLNKASKLVRNMEISLSDYFASLDERGKMEHYADISYNADMFDEISNLLDSKRDSDITLPFIHFIANKASTVASTYRKIEKMAYPLAYPNNPDFDSKEYIDMVHDFYKQKQDPELI